MVKPCILVGAMLASAIPCLAQTAQAGGFLHNVGIGATSRGSMAGRAGELLFRFDSSDYTAIGRPQNTSPTANDIDGIRFILQDQDALTVEPYNLNIYGEDPLNPDFPNFAAGAPGGTNALGTFGPFNSPAGAAGPAAWFITVTFTTPVGVPAGQDMFLGVDLAAAAGAGWTADGLSVQISLGTNPNFPPPTTNTYDLQGPALISPFSNSYGLVHDRTNSLFAYGGKRQGAIDIMTLGPAGVGTAITNQPNYPTSNAAPGTASFMSGLHPDAANPPLNGARVDDIGYVYFDHVLPTGSLVLYLADLAVSPVQLPLAQFVPGSVGVVCLTPALTTLSFAVTATQGAGAMTSFNLFIPAAARNTLLGSSFAFTAIGFDPVAGILRGAPCVTQKF